MAYKLVKAKSPLKAIEKSGFAVGRPAIVTDINVSHAGKIDGKDAYSVIPIVRELTEEEQRVCMLDALHNITCKESKE